MLQIAYTSAATQNLASGDVFKIIEISARNNAQAQLTGFLIYSNSQFFQVIEGPVESVDVLINRLKTDPRHHAIKIVYHSRILERSFPNWGMKRVFLPEDDNQLEDLMPELATAPEKVKRAAENFLNLAVA